MNKRGRPGWVSGLGSVVFFCGLVPSILVYATLMLCTFALSLKQRVRLMNHWVGFVRHWLKLCCGLDYQVHGLEHLPQVSAVILARHSSTWETFMFQGIFPPLVWITKHELLRVPFFGWGLAMLKPIAINRALGRSAVEQIRCQGTQRLADGFWVMCFPETTRMAPGQFRRFGLGGAVLAASTGAPVVPVAHNAGCYWRRRSFVKYPGAIQVHIGPVIETAGLDPEEINARAKAWVDQETQRLEAASELLVR